MVNGKVSEEKPGEESTGESKAGKKTSAGARGKKSTAQPGADAELKPGDQTARPSAVRGGVRETESRRGRSRRFMRDGEELTRLGDSSAGEASDGFGFTFEEHDVMPDLDPQLQHVLLAARSGRIDPALVQEADDGSLRVDVMAVLRDPNEQVPGLEVTQSVGDIVTGSCDVDDIEAVRQHPNIISLKGATKVESNLRFSVPEIRGSQKALREALPTGAKVPDGTGVIVGVVDFGCDYAHENFRNQDGTTRLLFLWDQNGPKTSMSPAGYPYGRELTAQHINEALRSGDPYTFLAYDPFDESHGTHVMDTAAGNGRGTGSPGVAPKADLIFVELSGGDYGPNESFGNSRRLMEAVKYIFDKAAQLGRPAVINLSLGTHGGPHDGSTPVERWFDELLKVPGRAIVVSAGNSWERRSHAAGRIGPGQVRTLGWEKFTTDTTTNELEIWYSRNAALEVTLVFPTGQRFGPTPLGANPRIIKDANGEKAGEVIHRAGDPLNGDNVINIFLGPRMPSGVWGVELRSVGAQAADFHAWIERDDDRRTPQGIRRNQSKFVAADDVRTHTVGSISCGRSTIAVGSYVARVLQRDLSTFSAEGPTRDGKRKPEVSAPGDEIIAASSKTGNGVVPMSGTSMAAPHVTGLVALVMQAAGRPLGVEEIRGAVIGAARTSPPVGNDWHPRYGNGRVDCAATVLSLTPQAPETETALEQSSVVASAAGDNGLWQPVDRFFDALLSRTHSGTVRVKLQIEAEYTSK